MSALSMTPAEQKNIDSQIEKMMDWVKSNQAEAEQLAMDSARLIACTGDRLDRIKNQGFFKRCWNRLTGKTGEMERANVNDLISMQKKAFRYMNMLQEQQMLMAHSLLALKNNLVALAVKEEETRAMVGLLAQKTLERFEGLESRVDQLEISTNLQGWLLGLEEREYDEKIPTDYMRLFRVINDFYQIKKDEWNYNDLMFMRKAIRTVGLNPRQKVSLNAFIDRLVDEIQSDKVGFDAYATAINQFAPEGIENYSKYALENISSPVFVALHGLKIQYMDRLDMVEELQDEMNISASEALKRLLRRSIKNLNVDMDHEFPLAETAIEILGCLRMAEKLMAPAVIIESAQEAPAIEAPEEKEKEEVKKIDVNTMSLGTWKQCENLPRGAVEWVIPGNEAFFVCITNEAKRSIYETHDFSSFSNFATFTASTYETTLPFFIEDQLVVLDPGSRANENPALFLVTMNNVERGGLPGKINEKGIEYTKVLYAKDSWYVIGKPKYTTKTYAIVMAGNDIHELQHIIPSKKVPENVIFDGEKFLALHIPEKKKRGIILNLSNDMREWEDRMFPNDSDMSYGDSKGIFSFEGGTYFYKTNKIFSIAKDNISSTFYSEAPIRGEYKENYIIDCRFQKYGLAFCVSNKELMISNDLIKWVKIDSEFPEPSFSGDLFGIFGANTLSRIFGEEEIKNPYVYGFGKLVHYTGGDICFRTME